MTTNVVSMLLAFLVSVCITPVARHMAVRFGMVDSAGVSFRKIHANDIPRVGGIAIVLGFLAPVLGLFVYQTGTGQIWLANLSRAIGLLLGAGIIALLGLYDDLYGASPKIKLPFQFVAAAVAIALGTVVTRIGLPFFGVVELGWLAIPLTFMWIVGVTNAVNLIDGLDGLASGIALIGLVPFTVVAVVNQDYVLALMTMTLGGAVAGFLVFNYHPAKIFMGDTGSMFLGFVLAVVAVQTSQKTTGLAAALVPLLSLGLPIMDTLVAIIRRMWLGQHPFAGDKQHIHHRLMRLGLSHRRAVFAMWGLAGLLALFGLVSSFNQGFLTGLVVLLSGVVAGITLRSIGFLKLERLGESIEEGASIRAYNNSVRYAAREFDRRIERAGSPEEALEHLDSYMRVIRARAAQLVLNSETPRKVWKWGEPSPGAAGPFKFPLVSDGEQIGVLYVVLDDDGQPVDVPLQRLEVSSPVIARSLEQSGGRLMRAVSNSLPPT